MGIPTRARALRVETAIGCSQFLLPSGRRVPGPIRRRKDVAKPMSLFSTIVSQLVNGLQSGSIYALVALGYNASDAARAVSRVDDTLPVQDIIKIALRGLSKL